MSKFMAVVFGFLSFSSTALSQTWPSSTYSYSSSSSSETAIIAEAPLETSQDAVVDGSATTTTTLEDDMASAFSNIMTTVQNNSSNPSVVTAYS